MIFPCNLNFGQKGHYIELEPFNTNYTTNFRLLPELKIFIECFFSKKKTFSGLPPYKKHENHRNFYMVVHENTEVIESAIEVYDNKQVTKKDLNVVSSNSLSRRGCGRPTCIKIGYSGPRAEQSRNWCSRGWKTLLRSSVDTWRQFIKIGLYGTVRLSALPEDRVYYLNVLGYPNVLRGGILPQCIKIPQRNKTG